MKDRFIIEITEEGSVTYARGDRYRSADIQKAKVYSGLGPAKNGVNALRGSHGYLKRHLRCRIIPVTLTPRPEDATDY